MPVGKGKIRNLLDLSTSIDRIKGKPLAAAGGTSEGVWAPPRFLIPVLTFLAIFGYFSLVLIGVELIETLKAYVKMRFTFVSCWEVALIAMARKVIIEEPNNAPSLTLFG